MNSIIKRLEKLEKQLPPETVIDTIIIRPLKANDKDGCELHFITDVGGELVERTSDESESDFIARVRDRHLNPGDKKTVLLFAYETKPDAANAVHQSKVEV